MYLQQSKNQAGRVYLSFVQGYRKDGKVKHKTIEKLGYLDDLQKVYEDPIAHFKRLAKEKNAAENAVEKKLEISLSEKLSENSSNRKNLGYAVPKAVYDMLGLYDFFQYRQRFINAEFNLNSIFSLLTFNRFMFPSSIMHAYQTKDVFFDQFDFKLEDCYRALDYFVSYSEDIQALLAAQTKVRPAMEAILTSSWDIISKIDDLVTQDTSGEWPITDRWKLRSDEAIDLGGTGAAAALLLAFDLEDY